MTTATISSTHQPAARPVDPDRERFELQRAGRAYAGAGGRRTSLPGDDMLGNAVREHGSESPTTSWWASAACYWWLVTRPPQYARPRHPGVAAAPGSAGPGAQRPRCRGPGGGGAAALAVDRAFGHPASPPTRWRSPGCRFPRTSWWSSHYRRATATRASSTTRRYSTSAAGDGTSGVQPRRPSLPGRTAGPDGDEDRVSGSAATLPDAAWLDEPFDDVAFRSFHFIMGLQSLQVAW